MLLRLLTMSTSKRIDVYTVFYYLSCLLNCKTSLKKRKPSRVRITLAPLSYSDQKASKDTVQINHQNYLIFHHFFELKGWIFRLKRSLNPYITQLEIVALLIGTCNKR
jgi:hypothetical protein